MSRQPASPGDGPAPRRGGLAWAALVLRGVAMGLAELVPGVSGGTIAFVTGIYEELVGTLARLRPAALAEIVAGVPGLEPGNDGIKTRCLTNLAIPQR